MKKYLFLTAFALMGLVCSVSGQSCHSAKKGTAKAAKVSSTATIDTSLTKTQFTVYGNCGMCKKTIEGALKDVQGVALANWDGETAQMSVAYDAKQIGLDKIKQRIADVGYDSDTHRAKKEVYDKLYGCCQYDRPTN